MFDISQCCRICLNPNASNKDSQSSNENGVDSLKKLEICIPEVVSLLIN